MVYISTDVATHPFADISINKNRLGKYGNKIYLQNGTNFEIELTNNTQHKYLAKISFNGKRISNSGIVLNPGQHVYLERYLDTNAKFKFDTYDVPKTKAAKKAIEKNGLVKIDFYKEAIPFKDWLKEEIYRYERFEDKDNYSNRIWYGDGGTSICNTGSGIITDNCTISSAYCNSTLTSGGSATLNYDDLKVRSRGIVSAQGMTKSVGKIETGRVEQGGHSNQSFQTVNGDFNSYVNNSITFHLLPLSEKPVNVHKVRNYCGCGRRIKTSWEFCPGCGDEV